MPAKQFKPAWWLPNSHLQTLWPTFCRFGFKNLQLVRERVELPDGDFLDLDWIGKEEAGPIVIILHGLEGSIDSPYAKGMLNTIHQHQWRGVFMHFRGCSGEPNRLPRNYHSGDTVDIDYIVRHILSREPDVQIAAIGYSLGGNVLLKWLGETKKDNPLKAAIAISVPFELHKAAEKIQQGLSRIYQWYFMKCLRTRLSKKFDQVKTPFDRLFLSQIQTMREFDDMITAPLHGFSDVDEYYTISSSRQYLRTICIPTLVLHAKDDPFMTEDVIPNAEELSSNVILEVTRSGGHVGFVSGKYPWQPQYWLESRVPEFLKDFLKK